jgi:TonB family protein
VKQTILIVIWLGISILTSSAQTDSCDLQLNIYKYQKNTNIEPEQIKNVTAILENSKSKRKIKAGFQNEMMPFFANLPKGTYTATISMKGYKVTTKEIELTCETEQAQTQVIENMFLWNGNSKETVKMFGTLFTSGSNDGTTIAKLPQSDSQVNKTETINGSATALPRPDYPLAARAVRASGAVQVKVTIDELGKVISAKPLSGHPLLQASAVKAAREAKFESTRLQDIPVKIVGIIVYNFQL